MQIMMELLVCSTEFELKKIIWWNSFLLDQREFLIGFALTSTGSIREKLKYVFRTYDHDKDGVINKKEIDRMIKVNKISFKFLFAFTIKSRLRRVFMQKMTRKIHHGFSMNWNVHLNNSIIAKIWMILE
jgi:Ca2+-binding EF-hand superfamily protein